jgi:hypothetical protein
MLPMGPQTESVGSQRLDGLPKHSSWFLGAEVEGARDDSWSCRA